MNKSNIDNSIKVSYPYKLESSVILLCIIVISCSLMINWIINKVSHYYYYYYRHDLFSNDNKRNRMIRIKKAHNNTLEFNNDTNT